MGHGEGAFNRSVRVRARPRRALGVVLVMLMACTSTAVTATARGTSGVRGIWVGGAGPERAPIGNRSGITIEVVGGQWWVRAYVIRERCGGQIDLAYGGQPSPTGPFGGSLASDGHFAAVDTRNGRTTVSGILKGNRGTATVTDRGPDNQPGHAGVTCHGAATFRLRKL